MTPQAREIIMEVARRRGVDPEMIASKCRRSKIFYARIEVAKRLDERGYSTSRIGAVLGHDHTTVVYYLGRAQKRPKPEPEPKPGRKRKWRPPVVRHVRWLATRPSNPGLYLVPYAGADMSRYVWRPRT